MEFERELNKQVSYLIRENELLKYNLNLLNNVVKKLSEDNLKIKKEIKELNHK